jgi:hypothetical protein
MMISRVAEATIVRVMKLSVRYKDFFISFLVSIKRRTAQWAVFTMSTWVSVTLSCSR